MHSHLFLQSHLHNHHVHRIILLSDDISDFSIHIFFTQSHSSGMHVLSTLQLNSVSSIYTYTYFTIFCDLASWWVSVSICITITISWKNTFSIIINYISFWTKTPFDTTSIRTLWIISSRQVHTSLLTQWSAREIFFSVFALNWTSVLCSPFNSYSNFET
ncbi:hypothetical protein BpHYR1_045068 [Brachionus plicatilis]|uniref:Uncharacterized protein n=1 Tax=Brachionus plicatilis TaxID=10195 RepID=A0A3M7SL20_BRAPC|nr:hypothetical protein BpHYR1_045068 [Brachionus plicatilis]